jgi:hypothetical protein
MESWKSVWRKGLVPLLSTAGLEALRLALAENDRRLIQGMTCMPPPVECVWPVQAADALAYCGWQGDHLETVAQVEEFFAHLCVGVDKATGEEATCRCFLNWYDSTPRDDMRRELLVEVQLALTGRRTEDRPTSADEDTSGPAAA